MFLSINYVCILYLEGEFMKVLKKLIVGILFMVLSNQFMVSTSNAHINNRRNNSYDNFDVNLNPNTDLKVSAKNAIAIDSQSKEVLWEQRGYEIVPMASTTKILTALVAINYGDLERVVTISKKAASIRGSTVGYSVGEEITVRELLFGLMFKSGNDAAIALAEDIGGSIENFSNIMNDFARSIGISDSHFESPHGLDSQNHYSSAYDLAILTAKAMENDVFREIVGEKIIKKDKYNFTREYHNINKILYKIPEANGVKTGYTGQAGKCLVSSIKLKDRNIIIVVLNCPDRWNVTEKIYKYIQEKDNLNVLFEKENHEEDRVISLGTIIEDNEFAYGYKDNRNLEVEVFSPVLPKYGAK